MSQGSLLVGGYFTSVGGGIPAASLARWDGLSWSEVGGGVGSGAPGDYQYVFDLGTFENDLYVGGNFEQAGGQPCLFLARYDGEAWFSVGDGVNGYVWDFAEYDGELVLAGDFTLAGGTTHNYIAGWDGLAWSSFGSGLNDHTYTLGIFNDDLFVGGRFYIAGGKSSWRIARWMGSSSGVNARPEAASPIVSLPNPYRAGDSIRFLLPNPNNAEVHVYDAGGRRVRGLLSGDARPGPFEIRWDGLGDGGRPENQGVYFLRVLSEQRDTWKRMVYIR